MGGAAKFDDRHRQHRLSINTMSAELMIRELFRGLETTLHERLSLIEQVLNTVEKPKVPLYDNEFVQRIERLEASLRNTSKPVDYESRIQTLEEELSSALLEIAQLKNESRMVQVTHSNPFAEEMLDAEPEPEEEEVEPEAEPEEEEEEGLELEEFEYKGRTFYKDPSNNVYTTDGDGEVILEPVGVWNGKRIAPMPQ